MSLKLVFYVPYDLKDGEEVKRISKKLDKVKAKKEVKIIEKREEEKLKREKLISVSVFNRIQIKQTRRTKSLYQILVLFDEGNALTFYPQRKAREEITIERFLEGLLNGKIECLHKLPETVVEELKKR